MYLLHRPAPGPSPCPLHTQQNSGRNGKKPILWPLQPRSSSTRLWCESSVYFYLRLWMFIADAANPKWFAPLVLSWSERWIVIARLSATTDPRFDSDGAQDDPTVVIAFVQRGEEAGCRAEREGTREGDKDLNASSFVLNKPNFKGCYWDSSTSKDNIINK